MLLPGDWHVHTYYSPCGRRLDDAVQPLAAPERHLARASELGLREIVFTDHFVEDPTRPGMVLFYKGSGPAILHDLRSELARCSWGAELNVYVGCETETLSTEKVGIGPELARQLDFVLAPTTHYHLPGVPQPGSEAPADVADHMLTMIASLVTKPWIDAVAHPFSERESLIGDLRAIYEAMDKVRLTDIMGELASSGIALEVNGSAITSEAMPHYGQVYAEVARLAKSMGLSFTFGSDAHDYRKVGLWPSVERWIVETGLERTDFLTMAQVRVKRLV